MQVKDEINSESCYEKSLNSYGAPLLTFAKSRISNKQDAEDVVQDCLLILSKKRMSMTQIKIGIIGHLQYALFK